LAKQKPIVPLLTQIAYSLIQLIFSTPLGFNTISATTKDREDKLISQLEHLEETEFLCALNQPFNVDFPMSENYQELSKKEKQKVLQELLLKLMKDCFEKLWVVIIDDIEYSDRDSMQILKIMIQLDMIFFILSIGHKLNGHYELPSSILKKSKV